MSSAVRRAAVRCLAVAAGLALDAVVGEPPAAWHPVAGFGTAMQRLEHRWHRDRHGAGVAYAAAGVAAAYLVGTTVDLAIGPTAALVLATALSSAGRSLLATAAEIGGLLGTGRLEEAREHVPALVGRDPGHLDEADVARAVVESVAENLTDAVVASALWGLVAGTRGVLVHRAANTLDSMVGHRSARYRRFGWAAARLDDVLAWPAARLTALLVVAARPAAAGRVAAVLRAQAPAHPSPNAGVAEGACAAALGLRLGGTNRYGDRVEVRPPLGHGPVPSPGDVGRAVVLARDVILVLIGGLIVAGVLGVLR